MHTPPIECQATSGNLLGMPVAQFLQTYWQKHPLLVRQALPGFTSPISPDELAGLACEDGALSRLIVHQGDTDTWQIRHGPLPESVFAELPERDWTLLVQDVDTWDAGVAELLAHFDFLPRWRIDDIMVSFAAPEGSVGAHIDQYDVFLIQGLGTRRWLIDNRPEPAQAFRDDVELKLLREFSPSHDWVLQPGDMLYLPPGVPHHGIALEDCLTLSVGMRAPSHAELLLDLADTLAEALPEQARYGDPDLAPEASNGRIDAQVLQRVRASLQSLAQIEDARLADWFTGFITRYRSAGQAAAPPQPPTPTQVQQALATGARLHVHPLVRCAWHQQGERASLHIDGERFITSPQLASQLARHQTLDADTIAQLNADDHTLIHAFLERGILVLSNPENH